MEVAELAHLRRAQDMLHREYARAQLRPGWALWQVGVDSALASS
jgi:hypothetical protein